ncbi:MAG TPA: hypothetical protein VND93_31235 [Myxococcales bacterium]|nr:hypothetical protein [Myxococcales bacterium]
MAGCALLGLSAVALAGPSLLRDARVWGATETPQLGRGYSPSTSTFRSICLAGGPGTEPSYDFTYDFVQVEDETDAAVKLDTPWSRAFVQDRMRDFGRLGGANRQYAKHLLVLLDVSTYYASVDESRTPLSDTARDILHNQGVTAFFTSCGSAYVRGITRNAQLVSVLTYVQGTPERDLRFEGAVRRQLHSIQTAATAAAKPPELPGHKRLTISSQAWGLGRAESATLVSYDIPTFKRAVQDAFEAANGRLAGRVVSVETVPWVENPDFLSQIRIEDKDLVEGRALSVQLKKDILTANAELLVEAEDAARARLDAFYKAQLCRAAIRERWAGQDGQTLLEEARAVELKNRRTVRPTRTVAQLDAALTDQRLDRLWKSYADLASGDAEGTVARCTVDLRGGEPGERGLFLRRYGQVASCAALQKKLSPEMNEDIQDYCPPETL